MDAAAFLVELKAAQAFELVRINGYQEILAIPGSLISQETITEVVDALSWSNTRLSYLDHTISNLEILLGDGYPARVQQIASGAVLAQLQVTLENMRLAVAEFQAPPKVTVVVGPEIPVV